MTYDLCDESGIHRMHKTAKKLEKVLTQSSKPEAIRGGNSSVFASYSEYQATVIGNLCRAQYYTKFLLYPS